jgi:hypothetical protein
MHLILGEARGNSAEAERLYTERFPNHRTLVVPLFLTWMSDCGKPEYSKEVQQIVSVNTVRGH